MGRVWDIFFNRAETTLPEGLVSACRVKLAQERRQHISWKGHLGGETPAPGTPIDWTTIRIQGPSSIQKGLDAASLLIGSGARLSGNKNSLRVLKW